MYIVSTAYIYAYVVQFCLTGVLIFPPVGMLYYYIVLHLFVCDVDDAGWLRFEHAHARRLY